MAAPIITTVSPATGKAVGGALVVITGANFQLPFAPPASGPSGPYAPSVRVTFGTRVSPRVLVMSTTELRVFVPRGVAGVVDVFIENVDATGAQVPGEYKTRAAAYTYTRKDLSAGGFEGTLGYVTRCFLRTLKEQVLENTSLTVHTDFDSMTSDNLQLIDVAVLPALVVTGPKVRENRAYSKNAPEYGVPLEGGAVVQLPKVFTVDMEFMVIALSDSTRELLKLMSELALFLQRATTLEVPIEQTAPAGAFIEYEMEFTAGGEPSTNDAPNESNVRQFAATVLIRGVDVEEEEAVGTNVSFPVRDDYVKPGSIGPAGADVEFTSSELS